jgi:WD40 repeat protein
VPVFDAGQDQGRHYIASAYIAGQTLDRDLTRQRPTFSRSARIVRALAEALYYAHQQGIVHRDVKPANVLIDAQDDPHLLDFGLAHQKEEAERLTQEGDVLGTPAYMAPEQARGEGGEPLPASDQYSLGVLLYEMLCSRPPFQGELKEVLRDVVQASPTAPRRLRPGVPRDLETICLKALAKRPEDRYPSCQELADDLRRYLDREPIRARRLGLVERLRRWCGREPVLALSCLAACLALTTAAVVPLISSALVAVSLRQEEAAREEAQRAEAAATERGLETERQRQAAVEAARQADVAIGQAREQKQKAEEAVQKAQTEVEKTRESITAVKQRVEALRHEAYAASIDLARQALEYGDPVQMRSLLDTAVPADGQADLRGFEWHYLRRQEQALPRFHTTGVKLRLFPVRSSLPDRPPEKEWLGIGAVIPGHAAEPLFTQDGRFLAKGVGSLSTNVEDLLTGKKVILRSHPPGLRAVLATADGKHLATLHGRTEIRLWEAGTGKEIGTITSPVSAAAFAPDSRTLVTAWFDERYRRPPEISLWEMPALQKQLTLQGGHPHGSITKMQFSPDGKLLASTTTTHVVLWDLATRKVRFTFSLQAYGHDNVPVFSPDGLSLASVATLAFEGRETNFRLWDVATGQQRSLQGEAAGPMYSMAFSPDGTLVAAGGLNHSTVTVWEVRTGRWRATLTPLKGNNVVVAFAPDGRHLAAGGSDGRVAVWDAAAYDTCTRLEDPAGPINALVFAGKSLTLAAAMGNTVILYDPVTKERRGALPEQAAPIGCVAGRPGDNRLFTAAGDGAVKVWNLETRQARDLLQLGSGRPAFLKLTPDGKQLLGATEGARVKAWDAETGKECADHPSWLGAARTLALSPVGQILATVGPDQNVRLWDLAQRKERGPLQAPHYTPLSLAFSPDGKTLATGGKDGAVKLWQVETGQELLALKGYIEAVNDLVFSPDGKMLVSGGTARSIRFCLGD